MDVEPTKKEAEIDALLEKMDGDLNRIQQRKDSGKVLRPTRVMTPRQLKRTRMVLQTISQVEIDVEEDEPPITKVNGAHSH